MPILTETLLHHDIVVDGHSRPALVVGLQLAFAHRDREPLHLTLSNRRQIVGVIDAQEVLRDGEEFTVRYRMGATWFLLGEIVAAQRV